VDNEERAGTMALSHFRRCVHWRYRGLEYRSRASGGWPSTSGLLSCHGDRTPFGRNVPAQQGARRAKPKYR
jgi:hypothetical protein